MLIELKILVFIYHYFRTPLTHFMTIQNSLGSHKTKPFSIPLNQSFLSINIRTFSEEKKNERQKALKN